MTNERLSVGDQAPDFRSVNQYGAEVVLTDLLAESAVMLLFYPFAFSGTCTGELRTLEKLSADFHAAGVRPISISCDTKYSQKIFADQEGYTFWMLTDFWPHGQIANDYRVFSPAIGAPIRGSFLIDRQGEVRWSVMNAPSAARDIEGHLEEAQRLNA